MHTPQEVNLLVVTCTFFAIKVIFSIKNCFASKKVLCNKIDTVFYSSTMASNNGTGQLLIRTAVTAIKLLSQV